MKYSVPDPSSSGDFSIKVTQEELLNVEFSYFGDTQDILGEKSKGLFTKIKRALLKRDVMEFAGRLEKLILNDQLTSGKVRIFPMLSAKNSYVINGYHYLLATPAGVTRNYIPRAPGYFEIDLTAPDSKDRYILMHIAYMMLAFDFGFVMTKVDDSIVNMQTAQYSDKSITIDEMICAFNRDGFLKPDEIFSQVVPSSLTVKIFAKFQSLQIKVLDESFPNFKFIDDFLLDGWKNEMCFTSGVKNADFESYMKYIKTVDDDYTLYIRQILSL